MKKEQLPDIIAEVKDEIKNLERLVKDISEVYTERPKSTKKRSIYHESLALKLHNFYTGCERIFQKIANDINGGVPVTYDWHRRLLNSVTLDIENVRPSVITKETATELEEFLAFRHVVRNIYGYELDPERLDRLVEKVGKIFERLKVEINQFISFLKALISLEEKI